MKILALNPPFLPKYSRESRSPAVTKSGTLYYPMWLCYAVGYLEKAGHEVCLVDAPAAGATVDDVMTVAKEFMPDFAVLGTSTPSIYNDIEIGELLKKTFPKIFVTLVGAHVSALPEETLSLSKTIDAVAFGEYDETLVELAEKLSQAKNAADEKSSSKNISDDKSSSDKSSSKNISVDKSSSENLSQQNIADDNSPSSTPTSSSTENAAPENSANDDIISDKTLSSILGIAYRDGFGNVQKNPPRPYIEDLDELPIVSEVYHKHLDIAPYFYGHSRHPLIVMVTGRGCPYRCTYCVLPQTMHGHRYRKRSIESIVSEFIFIRDNFPNAQEIMIEDDTLTVDRKRCRQLSEMLIAAGAHRIPWSANSRADVDYETMCLMRKAGCRLFCVGFESGDQTVLDNIQKGITLDKIAAFTRDAKRAGIMVHGCFMVGNRGETRETLEKTLKFAKELNPDTAQFYPIMVYPGTSDYKWYGDLGHVVTRDFRKWLTEDGLHSSVVSNPDLTYEELVAFCDRARREFYLRPTYMFSKFKQMITHPKEAKRIVKAGFTLLKYLVMPSIKHKAKAREE